MKFTSHSVEETQAIARAFAQNVQPARPPKDELVYFNP